MVVVVWWVGAGGNAGSRWSFCEDRNDVSDFVDVDDIDGNDDVLQQVVMPQLCRFISRSTSVDHIVIIVICISYNNRFKPNVRVSVLPQTRWHLSSPARHPNYTPPPTRPQPLHLKADSSLSVGVCRRGAKRPPPKGFGCT